MDVYTTRPPEDALGGPPEAAGWSCRVANAYMDMLKNPSRAARTGERLHRVQRAGVVAILAGVVLMAAG